jgi:Na+-transporting NADH:ubiquinone oxidoreductase subunit C
VSPAGVRREVPARPRAPALESAWRTMFVSLLVFVVCSVLVTTADVLLRPVREARLRGERDARIREILSRQPGLRDLLAGEGDALVLDAVVVDLPTGRVLSHEDPAAFEEAREGMDPSTGQPIPPEEDVAGLVRRPLRAVVTRVLRNGALEMVVLPIRGQGHVSTIHGLLAVAADGNTILGVAFYDHEETPGLGAEIESESWRARFRGKRLRDETRHTRFRIVQAGTAVGADERPFVVDAITGATGTSVGVGQMIRFWTGPLGFGPFLERLWR